MMKLNDNTKIFDTKKKTEQNKTQRHRIYKLHSSRLMCYPK